MNTIPIPVDFVDQLAEVPGIDTEELLEALNKSANTSIRLNPYKKNVEKEGWPLLWSERGRVLDNRPVFTLDPHFHGGAYYVQESSSQFIEQLCKSIQGPIGSILDACAAPGGKTTHLMSLFPDSVIFSNEINRKRYQILKENIIKHGGGNAFLLNKSTNKIAESKNLFDLVLIDAPCSGEGMFRKDFKAREEWSLSNVDTCVARQEEIIDDLIEVVAQDGYIIYSTCTFNLQENDQMVQYIMDQGFDLLSVDKVSENIVSRKIGEGEVYSFLPGRTPGEGFFCALLKRNNPPSKKVKVNRLKSSNNEYVKGWLDEDLREVKIGGLNFLWPNKQLNLLEKLDFSIVSDASLIPGELKGKNYIPDHSLAMSRYFKAENSVSVSKEMALEYLRKDNIKLPIDQKGMIPINFEGTVLGWLKVISPTRSNNYYPKEWRIRNL